MLWLVVKVVKSLEDSIYYRKELVKQFKMKLKKRVGFLSTLLAALGASLLRNILAGRGIDKLEKELLELVMEIKKVKKARKKRQDYENKMDF